MSQTTDPPNGEADSPAAAARDGRAVSTLVVGAGIGGLLAAITAAERDPGGRVVVLDPHPPGGRARCDHRGGFLFNRGPRGLYVDGPADRALTGVGVDTTQGGPPQLDRGALALLGGRTHRFPSGPAASLRTTLLTARQKLEVARAMAALWRADTASTDGRSLSAWLDELGVDGVPRQFIEALVRVATYAHAPDTFAAGPALANARAGTRPGVRYLDGGWQSLVDQLVAIAARRGVEIVVSTVQRIDPTGGSIRVEAEGTTWSAANVVVAAGGPDAAAALLPARPDSWDRLAPPVTAACLELGIRGVPAHRFLLGIDEPLYGSTHAPPADLAPEGHSVVHLMRYQPPGDEQPASEQRDRLREVATLMGISAGAIVEERFLARMVVAGTLPHPDTGGLAGRPPVTIAEHPGVLLVGDWVGPTGLLLDAVAASATEAGRLAAERSATMVTA
ncbi:MAG: Dehydrogenase [Ilumatobacteraceae bacterium]|nr:Dehydrogenase [Ilumatobacteraceae bacterium]